jgi:hypothetical protein
LRRRVFSALSPIAPPYESVYPRPGTYANQLLVDHVDRIRTQLLETHSVNEYERLMPCEHVLGDVKHLSLEYVADDTPSYVPNFRALIDRLCAAGSNLLSFSASNIMPLDFLLKVLNQHPSTCYLDIRSISTGPNQPVITNVLEPKRLWAHARLDRLDELSVWIPDDER